MKFMDNNGCMPIHRSFLPMLNENFPLFFVVEEGKCNQIVKAINAENSGAKLLIIITSKKGGKRVDPEDFGARIVNIPVLYTNQKRGKQLKSLLEQNKQILVKFRMPIP